MGFELDGGEQHTLHHNDKIPILCWAKITGQGGCPGVNRGIRKPGLGKQIGEQADEPVEVLSAGNGTASSPASFLPELAP